MTTGLNPSDPTVVAAFRSALLHQGIAALIIFGVLALAWAAARDWHPAAARGGGADPGGGGSRAGGRGAAGVLASPGISAGAATSPSAGAGTSGGAAERAWRRVLRIGFGVLWLFDGILQAQPAMAVGLPSKVIEPAAQSSPGWVQHLVNWGGTAWSYHPVQAGAAAVWIQVGLGLWLVFAARGPMSRLAGLAGAAWGLVVWVFGEAFGEVLAPGLSWLTGAPGGVAYYVVAGALIALPARHRASPRLARLMLGGTGLFLAGMAVLQAWPGRGWWQGTVAGQPGPLTSMISDMAGTAQPAPLAALVTRFGSFAAGHGFAVNLVAVLMLAATGVALAAAALAGPGGWQARQAGVLLRGVVLAFAALCLVTWVLVQDFGFFGGLGTDPNSMVPVLLVTVAGYLAFARTAPRAASAVTARAEPSAPVTVAPELAVAVPEPGPGAAELPSRDRLRPSGLQKLPVMAATASVRTVLSASAVGVILLGAVPMAAAQASPRASAILAESIDGPAAPLSGPAPGFTLTDQDGRLVSLASLRGSVVLLTFLDPVCLTDCPLEAQELRAAGLQLGAQSGRVKLVAVNLNPVYNSPAYTRAFDRQEQLADTPDWLFLTGSPAELLAVWRHYGIASRPLAPGSMLGHSDAAFVIGADGRLREEINFSPGPGTAATRSSFATELADAARQAIAR